MADIQNQIIALRRQIDRLENTNVVFNDEPKNPNSQTVYVNSSTGETKYWTGKEWVVTSGTGGGLTGWNTTATFTATDYRTIAWTSGVVSIGTKDGKTDYATTSGNFTMAATTYFYWQADNPTAIQTTSTAGNVVVAGGVLIAVGRLNPDTSNLASLKVFGGPSVDQIIADEIVANSITSNMLQSNTVTASKLATTLLYAGAITLDTNGLIKGGQTAYNTGTGFFLGYSGGSYKFSLGNPAGDHLYWDGANLVLSGSASLVGTLPWSSITNDGNKPADNATVGATWGTNLNSIPATLTTPSGNGLYLASTHMGYYNAGAFTSYIRDNGDFFFKGDAGSSIDWNVTTAATLTIKGKIQAGTGSVILSSYLSGEVPQGNINVANSGWNNTCAFSVTDADTVSWGAGSLITSTGTTYAISAGNTGNMAALTYIYLDTAVSTTTYRTTTTASTAVGAGKLLIAVAQNGTGEATFQTIGGTGLNINGANIVPATITNAELGLLAVNTANIAASAITTAKIASGAVTSGELATGAVTTAKIAALAITADEIASSAITTAKIAADAVTSVQIATGAVGSTEIAAGAIIAGKITAGTIVSADIATGTITAGNIAAGTITATQIAAGTITATQIAALTITAGNIAAGTITAAKIAAGTITASEIAAGTITAANIAALTITSAQIAAGTITASKIFAGTITTAEIASGTITASNIAASTITGAKIAAGTITAANITAGTITANEIATSTITAGKMSVTTLSSIVADLGSITAGTIVLPSGGFIRSGQTAYNTGTGFYLGNDVGVTKFSIGISSGNRMTWDGTTFSVNGSVTTGAGSSIGSTYLVGQIPQGNMNVANAGWNNTCVFSVTDADTVSWSAGSLITSTGTTYAIAAGNTSNMTAKTYIFLDTATSTTAYQITTTASTAVGAGKVLIAVAQNGTGEATFQTLGGTEMNISGGSIVPATITSSELALLAVNTGNIAANAITTAKIATDAVTSAQIATGAVGSTEIAAGAIIAGKITAGTIVSADIAAGTITASNIAALTITAAQIAAGTITASKILSGTITANEIAALTITAANIAASTITGAKIAAGTITASNIVAGTITANEIAASTITAGKMSVTTLSSIAADLGNITAGTIVLPTGGFIRSGQTAYNTGTGFYLGNDAGVTKFSIGIAAGNRMTWDGTTFSVNGVITTGAGSSIGSTYLSGAIPQANLSISNRGWGQSCAFSVTDLDTVSWGAGTFVSADGTSYSIAAGNTGNMTAKTYVYLDIGVSTTAYQKTTTSSTAVGSGKVLVAVAQNGASEATYFVMSGQGGQNINASDIAAASITANEIALLGITSAVIAAGAVTTAKIAPLAVTNAELAALAVTGAKIAANTITAANISALTITSNEIAANTITAGKIAALTITANEIAASTITGAKIAAGTITASNITAGTITATQIAAGTITATQIAAGTITAANIVSGTITTNQIATGTITAANVSSLNMTGKSCTFDTGTVGGWTLGATTLSATGGGNTTTLSSGSTAFSAGPTGSPSVTITQSGLLTATGATINGVQLSTDSIFGNGSDGDVTISSGTTTLTRDMFYNSLTVSGAGILNPNGYKVYVKGALSGNGTIIRDGTNGSNGTSASVGASPAGGNGGSALNQGTLMADIGGSKGGNGTVYGYYPATTPPTTPPSVNPSFSNINGADGGGNTLHGTSTRGEYYNRILTVNEILTPLFYFASSSGLNTTTPYKGIAGSSGGIGGPNGGYLNGYPGGSGGGSGGNGGVILISANTFNFTGTVYARGGTGGNGGNGLTGGGGAGAPGAGGGGGGAGGNGGIAILIGKVFTSTGTKTLTGGAGGTGGLGGADAVPGPVGPNGSTGNTGETIQITV